MKRLIILLLVSSTQCVVAQINPTEIRTKITAVKESMKKFCDSVTSEIRLINDSDQIASLGSYKAYIDQYFTYLSYNRGVLPTGNSASLELTNSSTKLNLSIARKFESANPRGPITILTGGVKASISDGVSQLFSGSNLSTGTSIFGNFAFLPSRINYRPLKAVIIKYDENGNQLPTPFENLEKSRAEYADYFCENASEGYALKYRALISNWVSIKERIAHTSSDSDISRLIKEKEEIEKQLNEAGLLKGPAAKLSAALKKEYAEKMYEIEIQSEAWIWSKLRWWSGGIIYTRLSYDTYNEKNTLAKRFGSEDFDEVGLTLTSHWFKQKFSEISGFGSTYFNLSYEGKTTNNYAILKSRDISNVIIRTPGNPDTVYSYRNDKKAKVITDLPYKKGWQHKFSSTFTGMLGSKQNTGVNLRGDWIVTEFQAPAYNTHLGALLRLVNNNFDPTDKKSSARLNFEIFIEFNDLTDVAKSGKSVWQNKLIGINTSLPFNKIFFK